MRRACSARLLTFEVIQRTTDGVPMDQMRRKFASGASLDHAARRCRAVMDMLERRIDAQAATGSGYLVGDTLTAADIYWAVFSTMLAPIEAAACPMPDHYRAWTEGARAMVGTSVPDTLIAHRERILRAYFRLPL